jgi:hypothetical protein
MRRTFGSSVCLCASAIALLLASGCGQGEGERCQVTSDCADGLVCDQGESGNGLCKPSYAVATTDAAQKLDAPSSNALEVESMVVDAEVKADAPGLPDAPVSLDTIVSLDTTASIDVTAVDTGTVDSL